MIIETFLHCNHHYQEEPAIHKPLLNNEYCQLHCNTSKTSLSLKFFTPDLAVSNLHNVISHSSRFVMGNDVAKNLLKISYVCVFMCVLKDHTNGNHPYTHPGVPVDIFKSPCMVGHTTTPYVSHTVMHKPCNHYWKLYKALRNCTKPDIAGWLWTRLYQVVQSCSQLLETGTNSLEDTCVDVSFCWFTIDLRWIFLKQKCLDCFRQAFI